MFEPLDILLVFLLVPIYYLFFGYLAIKIWGRSVSRYLRLDSYDTALILATWPFLLAMFIPFLVLYGAMVLSLKVFAPIERFADRFVSWIFRKL